MPPVMKQSLAMPMKKPRFCHPLHSAIEANDKEFIEKLFYVNDVSDINAVDERGLTPLHVAMLYKNEVITKLLIRNGANINVKSNGTKILPEIRKVIKAWKLPFVKINLNTNQLF